MSKCYIVVEVDSSSIAKVRKQLHKVPGLADMVWQPDKKRYLWEALVQCNVKSDYTKHYNIICSVFADMLHSARKASKVTHGYRD